MGWEKVVLSGSDASLNSILVGSFTNHSTISSSHFTGSFTGSFVGDGSGLTGVTANADLPNGVVSSSAQFNSIILPFTGSYKGSISFTSSFASDHSVDGVTTTFTAAASLVFGEVCQVTGSGRIVEANASASFRVPAMLLMAENTVSTNDSAKFLLAGFARDDTWNWIPGRKLYLSNVSGQMTQSAPSNTNDTVQVVGYAVSADVIYFNPSVDTVVLG